jgi:hypothetical protein
VSYDVFQEVDEEVRREQLLKLWQRYQNLVFAGIALILLGVASWRAYDWWEAKKAAETGTAFEAAIMLAQTGKHAEAEAAFARIAVEGTSGYRALARLREAAELGQTDAKAAVSAYEKIAGDSSVGSELQDLAGIRAGALLIDADALTDARKELEPFAADGRPYRHTARELLALAAWRAGDIAAAKQWFDMILTDILTPPDILHRVEMLAALVASETKG